MLSLSTMTPEMLKEVKGEWEAKAKIPPEPVTSNISSRLKSRWHSMNKHERFCITLP